MTGKPASSRRRRREESQTKTGKSQRLVTSSPTSKLKEDAPPYQVGTRSTASQTSEEKLGTLWKASLPLKFIDLFCGIGGFRLAFQNAGKALGLDCECVFSSDWNKYSRLTYKANFDKEPEGDIHAVAVADIPKHDILCAGFPCQPFSIAGVSKKLSLGKKHGFEDKEQDVG